MPLFHRHARGLILTEQGELLYRTARECSPSSAIPRPAAREQGPAGGPAQGPRRRSAFGSIWLTPRMREFLELYPDIQVSLVLSDDELDLACARPTSRSACRRRASPT